MGATVDRRTWLKLAVGGGTGLALGGVLDVTAVKAAARELKLANVSEFTGVVELNRVPRVADDLEAVAKILAKGMDVKANDIRILHWSRLH